MMNKNASQGYFNKKMMQILEKGEAKASKSPKTTSTKKPAKKNK